MSRPAALEVSSVSVSERSVTPRSSSNAGDGSENPRIAFCDTGGFRTLVLRHVLSACRDGGRGVGETVGSAASDNLVEFRQAAAHLSAARPTLAVTYDLEAYVDLFKIQHELVADRTADAWYRLKVAGPSFHYRWDYGSGPGGAYSNISDEHHSRAVCREEVSLTMSWGMTPYSRDERNEPHFDWAKDFLNPVVRLSGSTSSGTTR